MKFRGVFIILSILVLLPFNINLVQAIAETNDCSPEVQAMKGDWKAVAAQVLIEYDMAQTIGADMPRAVSLQALRRCLDQQWRQLGDKRTSDEDEIYWLAQNALNLTVDSIISAQVGNADAANSFATQASEQYAAAAKEIGPVVAASSAPAGTIDIPQEGEQVPDKTQVSGTYAANALSPDKQLWLLVGTPDGKIYPQANNTCSDDPNAKREPIPFDLFGGNSWTMTVGLGGSDNVGQKFKLILVTADASLSAFFNQWLDTQCGNNAFAGIDQSQIVGHGQFVTVQIVTVTRK